MVEAIWLVAARVSWASFFTSAATTAKLRPASPARAASIVALRASMLVLRAMVSMVERDVLDLAHRLGEAGHPLAQLDDQVGQAVEDRDRVLDRGAARVELGLGLLGEQPRLVGRIRDPRLVGEQPGGDLLERVEHLQMVVIRSATPAT